MKRRLHLFVRAHHLPKSNKFVGSRPSTYAVISTVTGFGDILGLRRHAVGRTEVVAKSASPEFATVIILDFDEGGGEGGQQRQHRIAVDIFSAKDGGGGPNGLGGGGGGSHGNGQSRQSSSSPSPSPRSSSSPSNGNAANASNGDRDELIAGVIFDVGTILRSRGRAMTAPIASDGSVSLQVDVSNTPTPTRSTCTTTTTTSQPNSSSSSSGANSSNSSSDTRHHRPTLKFQLRGRRLHNTRLLAVLDRPSYYYDVHRKIRTSTGDSWGLVYRSDVVADSLNPMWDGGAVYLEQFCNADLDWPIRVSILDVDGAGRRTLMGSFETTVTGLIESRCVGANWDVNRAFAVRNGHKFRGKVAVVDAVVIGGYERRGGSPLVGQNRKGAGTSSPSSVGSADSGPVLQRLFRSSQGRSSGRSSGQQSSSSKTCSPGGGGMPPRSPTSSLPPPPPPEAAVDAAVSSQGPSPTFDDYVNDGHCQVEMCVAVDFTSSNGDRDAPGTHHYMQDGSKNDYEFALAVIGSVVSKFAKPDFRMWGFGSRFGDEDDRVYNIFQCGRSATARGVEGMLQAYRSTFDMEPIFGDEIEYGDVVQAAASHAARSLSLEKARGRLSYTILLVITPGNGHAFNALAPKLDLIGRIPLSILFVCLDGGSSHADLGELMDANVLEGGRAMITFVDCGAHSRCSKSLARAAFGGLPEQVVEFFVTNGLYPKRFCHADSM